MVGDYKLSHFDVYSIFVHDEGGIFICTKTTIIYTYVLNRGSKGVISPIDSL